MDYKIEELNNDNIHVWEDFNQKSPQGTFFHTIKWKNILESIEFVSHYFMIIKDGEVAALCPFFETTIKNFKGLTSLPKSDYNHIIVQDNDPRIIKVILKELKMRARKNSWSFLTLNSLNEVLTEKEKSLKYPAIGNMILDLEHLSLDKIWNEVFTNKIRQRKFINRFERDRFKIKDVNSLNDVKLFYRYYKKNIEHIKGDIYPYSHYKELFRLFYPENLKITLLSKNDFVAGGLLTLLDRSKKTMYIRYLALNREISNTYHPPYYLYWDAIKTAYEMDFNKICFGTTPNDRTNTNFRIKRNFGCEYENRYSKLIPLSKLFLIGYKAYTYFKPI